MQVLILASLVALVVWKWLWERGRRKQHELPSLGFESVWKSYASSIIDVFRANATVKNACAKYNDKLFTYAQLGEWCVMVKSREHVRDLCNAQEDVLSMEAAANELLQAQDTVGELFPSEIHHIYAIKTSLNLNLASKLPEMLDELVSAYHDEMRVSDDWTPIRAAESFKKVISRVSNRVFVGRPLCRNEGYINLVSQFSNRVIIGGAIIRMLVPRFLRPWAGRLFRHMFRHHQRMLDLVAKEIDTRRRRQATGDSHLNPNDMITWLMDRDANNKEHSTESIAMQMLNVNFVALHTTTKAFTHALYHLASKPEYIAILREEVEMFLDVQNPLSWTKESIGKCIKIDSFLKETLRLNGLGAIWMPRMTLRDFTFSDGTTIPAGNFVAIAVTAIHEDGANYDRSQEFDGLRFANMTNVGSIDSEDLDPNGRTAESEAQWMHRLTGTSPTYLTFGGGRHICPGRFFASLEMKCLLAFLLIHYDLKMPKDGARPPDQWMGPMSNPAPKAEVLFKRRKVILSAQ